MLLLATSVADRLLPFQGWWGISNHKHACTMHILWLMEWRGTVLWLMKVICNVILEWCNNIFCFWLTVLLTYLVIIKCFAFILVTFFPLQFFNNPKDFNWNTIGWQRKRYPWLLNGRYFKQRKKRIYHKLRWNSAVDMKGHCISLLLILKMLLIWKLAHSNHRSGFQLGTVMLYNW